MGRRIARRYWRSNSAFVPRVLRSRVVTMQRPATSNLAEYSLSDAESPFIPNAVPVNNNRPDIQEIGAPRVSSGNNPGTSGVRIIPTPGGAGIRVIPQVDRESTDQIAAQLSSLIIPLIERVEKLETRIEHSI